MLSVIRAIFAIGPLLFGIGFLAPLIAQSLEALGITAPLGLSPLALGLAIGGATGLLANLRGSWV